MPPGYQSSGAEQNVVWGGSYAISNPHAGAAGDLNRRVDARAQRPGRVTRDTHGTEVGEAGQTRQGERGERVTGCRRRAGLGDRGDHCLDIQRNQSSEVEHLGLDPAFAQDRVRKFRMHDEELLQTQYLVYDDDAALLQTSKEALADLDRLFQADIERADVEEVPSERATSRA